MQTLDIHCYVYPYCTIVSYGIGNIMDNYTPAKVLPENSAGPLNTSAGMSMLILIAVNLF